jgi:hypothetical protein
MMNASTSGPTFTWAIDTSEHNASVSGHNEMKIHDADESTTDSLVYVQVILSCLMYAAAGTIFYKKSFNSDMFSTVMTFAHLGLFANCFGQSHPIVTVTCLLVMTTRMVMACPKWYKSLNTVVLFAVLFMALLDAQVAFLWSLPYWVRIIVTALPQFIRRPLWLKAKLQDVRSKMGPLYVLYVTLVTKDILENRNNHLVWQCLAVIAMVSAIVAGAVFKPDNKAAMELFCTGTTLSSRKYYHARLMITSLTCISIVSLVCII